jgi:cytochrome oxidase assembly protein ShyY1
LTGQKPGERRPAIRQTGGRWLASPAVQIFERRWVYGHLLAGFMAVLFVFLGVWQFNRNTHKHYLEVRNKAAYAAPAPDLSSPSTHPTDGSRVEASGTFDAAHETVLRNQVKNDNVGVDVLTPLRLANGTAVLVDRGWVRASATTGVTTDPPPGGTAVVHGVVQTTNPLSPDTVNHLPDGRLAIPRVDLAAIGRTLPYKLAPVWIQAQAIQPSPTGNAPSLPQPPPPDPVNHMEYAIEWFAFALIPLIGWPVALRRLLRQRKPSTSSHTASADNTTPVASRS